MIRRKRTSRLSRELLVFLSHDPIDWRALNLVADLADYQARDLTLQGKDEIVQRIRESLTEAGQKSFSEILRNYWNRNTSPLSRSIAACTLALRREHRPPGQRLLTALVPGKHRDAVLGDMEEIRAREAAEHGPRQAQRWYGNEALRSALRFFWATLLDVVKKLATQYLTKAAEEFLKRIAS